MRGEVSVFSNRLKLKTVVMKRTTPSVFCDFQETNPSDIIAFERVCLALILTKDSIMQWETLVLSNEMCFTSNDEFVGDSKQIF